MSLRGTFGKCAVRALMITALTALVALLDPLGLDDAVDRHSADVVSRMTAPYYGYPDYRGRDQVAVIEISDHTLNAHDLGWPAPRFLYAGLIRFLVPGAAADPPGDATSTAVADQRPAAIFLDFALVSNASEEDRQSLSAAISDATAYTKWQEDKGCQTSALSKISCITARGGVPVIIGKGYPPNACLTRTNRRASPDDVALARMSIVAPLGWPNLPTRFQPVFSRQDYVETLKTALPALGRPATSGGSEDVAISPGQALADRCDDLNPDLTASAETGGLWAPLGFKLKDRSFGYDLTPATAMAYALCLRREAKSDLCSMLAAADKARAIPDFKVANPAGPEWGSVSDPENIFARRLIYGESAARGVESCPDERPSPWRVATVGWSQLTSGLGQGAAATAVPCSYHLTLDADAFMQIPADKAEDLRGLFKDRAVAIGAAQVLSNDWISTTLNARQPGVHYHAMALDNLLENGFRLRRSPQSVFPEKSPLAFLGLDWGEVLEFCCLFLIALMIEWVRLKVKAVPAYAPFGRRPRPWEGGLRLRLKTIHSRARDNWRNGQDERHRIAWVAGALLASILLMSAAVAITLVNRWEPVNVVGILGFTLLFAAVELWDVEGWAATLGLIASAAILAPARLITWFRPPKVRRKSRAGRTRKTSAPPQDREETP